MPVAELKSHLRMIHSFLGQHLNEKKEKKTKAWVFRPWNLPASDYITLQHRHVPVLIGLWDIEVLNMNSSKTFTISVSRESNFLLNLSIG